MVNASNSHEFERAAWLRDQISSVESVIEGQRLASAVRGDLDAIAIASSGELADVQVFFIRSSRLVGREHFTVDSVEGETCEKVMTSFVKQYYSSAARIPPLVLLEYEIEEKDVILNWLRYERGGQVSIVVPRRGVRRELINVVQENAKHGLEQLKFRLDTDAHAAEVSLNELAEKLSLPLPPKRIECYDISNIHGTNAVGSMVVFEDAMPRRDKYRRFLIKTVPGADDYAMLREIIGRRFRHGSQNGGEWSVVPDLVVVDGGIGQLNAVTAVLQELGTKIPAVGLAKQREEIFLPGQSIPMSLPAYSHSRRLLQRIRDEAHRFAISYHRKLRQKNSVASVLDNIPGIGIRKRRELIRKFGSVKGIRSAGLDELVSVPGINRELAEKIMDSVGNDSKRQLLD
jgi:excinuclease ABC subunit C